MEEHVVLCACVFQGQVHVYIIIFMPLLVRLLDFFYSTVLKTEYIVPGGSSRGVQNNSVHRYPIVTHGVDMRYFRREKIKHRYMRDDPKKKNKIPKKEEE